MATKIIKNIPLENVSEIKAKEETIIFERFNMIGNIFAQHNRKNLSILLTVIHRQVMNSWMNIL